MSTDWRARITILRADYRETLGAAADAGGVDLVLTSPPYCDARGYGQDVVWTLSDYAELGDHIARALKPGGWAIVNVDAPVRDWRPGFGSERGLHPWRVLLDWADRVGLRVPDRLAFGRRGTPGEYRGRFRNDWEPLLWFQRPGAAGYFDRTPLAEDGISGAYTTTIGRNSKHEGVRVRRMSGWAAENGKIHRGTMWDYGVVGNGHTGAPDIEAQGHPARWPYRLAADIIRCFCPPPRRDRLRPLPWRRHIGHRRLRPRAPLPRWRQLGASERWPCVGRCCGGCPRSSVETGPTLRRDVMQADMDASELAQPLLPLWTAA